MRAFVRARNAGSLLAPVLVAALLPACSKTPPPSDVPAGPGSVLVEPWWVPLGGSSHLRWNGADCDIAWSVASAPPGSTPRLEPDGTAVRLFPDLPGDYVVRGAGCQGTAAVTVHGFRPTLKVADGAPVTLAAPARDVTGDDARVGLVFGGVEVFSFPGGTSLGRTAEPVPFFYGAALSGDLLATATFACPACKPCCATKSCDAGENCAICCPTDVPGGAHVYSLVDGVRMRSTVVVDDAVELALSADRLAVTTVVGLTMLADVSDPAAPVRLGCVRERGGDPDLNVAFDGSRVVGLSMNALRVWEERQFAPDCLDTVPAVKLVRQSPTSWVTLEQPALAVTNGLALAGGYDPSLEVFDLAARPPREVVHLPDVDPWVIAASGEFALAGSGPTYAIDLRDRAHPAVAAIVPVFGRPVALGKTLAMAVSVDQGESSVTELHPLAISPLP